MGLVPPLQDPLESLTIVDLFNAENCFKKGLEKK